MEHVSGGYPLLGRLLASPTNIRLGWSGLPGTNTLAYCKNLSMTIFIVKAPGTNVIKLFTDVFYIFLNKFECLALSLASLSSLV